jgi:hypothetical protein
MVLNDVPSLCLRLRKWEKVPEGRMRAPGWES